MNRFTRILIGIILLGGAGAVALFIILPRLSPSWYEPPDPADARVVELAERVEYRLLEEAQKIRPEEPTWALRITEVQVNAWLAVRLRAWVAGRDDLDLPSDIDLLQMHFEPGRITVAAQREGGQIFVVAGRLWIDDDGQMRLEINRAGLGRLATRGDALDAVIDLVGEYLRDTGQPEAAADLPQIVRGEIGFPAVLPLADERVVVIHDLALEDRAVVLGCRTANAVDHP